MKILLNITTSDIIAIVSAVIAFGSAFLSLYTIYQTKKDNEARLAGSLLKSIQQSEALYLFEYGVKWYVDGFHGSKFEPLIDGFISLMNYVCLLRDKGLIKNESMKFFEYYLDRASKNLDCQCYLWNLYHFNRSGNGEYPFSCFIDYAKTLMDEEKLQAFESKEDSKFFVKNKAFK